ncbi:hypothetical protein [Neolewinella antarctica]|uniref:Outer membrane protein beta-barrel domain-containing protein n=1 Tax=Neolewinella antarctica TaxID=442734 RepID=A0ABX0XBR7_9BACT|nr:hypothetical protein [Neolewinella antarctica]NJC26716.1 hypothetical protein [Neolewinella antarctica]
MHKSIFFLLALLTFSTAAFAQTTEEEATDDLDYYNQKRSTSFDDGGGAFWYGTGAQLGFSGGNGTSFFNIGITPILGYKINDIISVGPRAGLTFNRYKDERFNQDIKESFFQWSVGAFARAKIFRGIFAHTEYSLVNEVDGFSQNGEPVRSTRAVPFLGAGFNQGGGPGQMGFEILVLFRLTQSEFINDSPYEFRTGVNFNF